MEKRFLLPLFWLCVFALLACGEKPVEEIEVSENMPSQVTSDYSTIQSVGGEPVWKLFGATAESFPGVEDVQLTTVRMIFYKDGLRDAELTSILGSINEKTQNTVAEGNVVIVTETGRTLESDILYWDTEKQKIHTDAFVRFTDGDQVLTGYGMETDPNLSNLVIFRQVEGEIKGENANAEPKEEF